MREHTNPVEPAQQPRQGPPRRRTIGGATPSCRRHPDRTSTAIQADGDQRATVALAPTRTNPATTPTRAPGRWQVSSQSLDQGRADAGRGDYTLAGYMSPP
jgi:hypothetical protein